MTSKSLPHGVHARFFLHLLVLLGTALFTTVGLTLQDSVQQRYSNGVEFFQQGQLDLAEQEFSAVIKVVPQAPEPYFFLGRICHAKGEFEKAEEMLREAVRLKPDFVEAYHSLGVVCLAQNKNPKAAEALLEAIRLKPDYALAHVNLANAYLGLEKVDEAKEEFRMALQLAPQDKAVGLVANLNLGSLYEQRGNYESALPYLENAHTLNPHHVDVLFSLCNVNFRLQRVAEATPLVQRLMEIAAHNPALHLRLGLLLVDNERYGEAESQFEQAQKLLPPSRELFQGLGTLHYHLGRYLDAERELSQALTLKSSPQAYLILGKVYRARDDPRAGEVFQKCVDLDPSRDEAWEELSRELAKRKLFDQAILSFQHYVEIFPQKPLAYLLLGEAYYNRSSFTRALEQFQKASMLDPQLPRAYYALGLAYKTMGKTEEARRHFQHALQLNPQSALTNYNLGDVFLTENNYQQAVLFFTQAVKLNPEDAEFYFKMGQAYFLGKDYPRAAEQLKKALQLRSDYMPAHYLLGRTYTALKKPALAQVEYEAFRTLSMKEMENRKAAARIMR